MGITIYEIKDFHATGQVKAGGPDPHLRMKTFNQQDRIICSPSQRIKRPEDSDLLSSATPY